jgi:NADPH:quinone reductase-like Zn-dependent oxidoreductase
MKAIVTYNAGGTENLIYQEIEKPVLNEGEILVKVKAIGINPADAKSRSSEDFLTGHLGPKRPAIIGWDIAGDIVEKAENTEGYEIGDAVFGLLRSGGAYVEYVAVPASIMALKPENISYEEAAAIPIAGITAWNPLVNIGKIKKGDKVLIHAGSGGVGHFAIQIAKHFGATVITTTSAKNKDFVLSLGADEVIDYTSQQFYDLISDVDFVLDTIGGDTLSHSIDITKENGTIITTIPRFSEENKNKALRKNIYLAFGGTDMANLRRDIIPLANLAGKGLLKSHIYVRYPFSQMAEAHTQIESGRTVGKIVVTL